VSSTARGREPGKDDSIRQIASFVPMIISTALISKAGTGGGSSLLCSRKTKSSHPSRLLHLHGKGGKATAIRTVEELAGALETPVSGLPTINA